MIKKNKLPDKLLIKRNEQNMLCKQTFEFKMPKNEIKILNMTLSGVQILMLEMYAKYRMFDKIMLHFHSHT